MRNLYGAFQLKSPCDGKPLTIIATDGLGWDHVSVSRTNRCPNWQEMEFVKRRFFYDHETAMQLHVPLAEHIDNHPYCLHLWSPQDVAIPRPPGKLVGAIGVSSAAAGQMSRAALAKLAASLA